MNNQSIMDSSHISSRQTRNNVENTLVTSLLEMKRVHFGFSLALILMTSALERGVMVAV